MKEVEWYTAKVYSKKGARGGRRIDLWDNMKDRKAAEKAVRDDGPDTPFVVVKVTSASIVRGMRDDEMVQAEDWIVEDQRIIRRIA